MGRISADGSLRLKFSLGESTELRQFGVQCALEHVVETDAEGRARSGWRFVGLKSCLVPEGRDSLLWHPLAGASVRFERAKIERSFSAAGATRWVIRECAADDYEIRAPDGRSWRYGHGQLIKIFHPALGELRCEGRGAWITVLRRNDAAAPLLVADYDENGRLISCTMEKGKAQHFAWNDLGQLSSWQRSDDAVVRFGYRDDLLCSVVGPGKSSQHFTWEANPGYERGDSRWAAPAHLASDETSSYTYELTHKGFVMHRREHDTGRDTVTIFNPRRYRLEQKADGQSLIVIFRKAASIRGAIERIQTGDGEVLEAYRYDERGQLVGMKRKGEPERELTYDETGRLMAMNERQNQ